MTNIYLLSLPALVRLALPYFFSFVLFCLFRLVVEDPWYSKDSWDYINCAVRGDLVWYRPLGYTEYLKFIHQMGYGFNAAILLQFTIFLAVSVIFLERIFILFAFQFRVKLLIWLLTIYNPFIFYLSNFLTTDSLFLSLTCLWMGSLVYSYVDKKRTAYIWIAIHCCCYYFMFSLRFNAIYYPVFSLASVFIYKAPLPKKILTALLPFVMVLLIISHIKEFNERTTGVSNYSALGDWAIANNALHIYRITDVDSDIWFTPDDILLNQCIMATKDNVKYRRGEVTDQYMWLNNGPLKAFTWHKVSINPRTKYFNEWFALAPMYRDYAFELILQYPGAFVKAFYLPNLKNCILPKMEMLDFRNEVVLPLDEKAGEYIGYSKGIYKYTKWQMVTSDCIKYAYFIINILIAVSACASFVLYFRKRKTYSAPLSTLLLFSIFHIVSILLLALAHPVWIRYIAFNELFMILIPICFLAMILYPDLNKTTDADDAHHSKNK